MVSGASPTVGCAHISYGILVMAYQLWHVSYGILVMAVGSSLKEGLNDILVMAYYMAVGSSLKEGSNDRLVMAYQLWHISYGRWKLPERRFE